MSKKYYKNQDRTLAEKFHAWRILAPILAVALFFLAVRLNTPSAGKVTAVLCLLAAFGAGALNFSTLRERFRLPLITLSAFVLMNGISTLYAVSGKFALREFLKLLVSFCTVLIFLSLAKGEGAKPGRTIATVLERCVALSGLVSIDFISTRILSTPVLGLLGLFTDEYRGLAGLEAGIRMVSISGNANVFAGYIGLGVLLSLGLVLSSENAKERAGHVVCLFVNSLSFVLAFSMGASGVIVAAFLVYLLLEREERRGGLFLLMAETLAMSAVAAMLVSMTSFDALDGSIRPIPLLCAVAGSAALCLTDRFVGQKLEKKLAAHGKLVIVLIAIALVAVLAFGLLAFNLTGGTQLEAGGSLRRSAYPAPGEYALSMQGSGAVTVKVESQNRQDTMMHTSTVLYSGDLAEAVFTVPEDSQVVYFNFRSAQGASLESVRYEGINVSEAGEIPLGYKLLPGFIANRLQGLFANQNAIQRIVFFEDGLKLFRKAPVFGLGIGAYESAIMSVQKFHYETKYAHNHYIQTLAETGVVGCILFVALLVVSAAAILRARKKEDMHPLVPALGAALAFMMGHAAMEVVFSAFDYIPIAFGVFALIDLCCGEAIPTRWLTKKVSGGILAGIAVLLMIFFGMLCSCMTARQMAAQTTFDSLERAAKMDKFEWADYALSYVVNAQGSDVDDKTRMKADQFADRLAKVDSNTIPIYLAEYYFFTDRMELAFDMVEKYVNYVSSKPATWETAFDVLEYHAQETPAYRERTLGIYQMLQDWNAANMGEIKLNQMTMDFITRMGG